MRPSHKTYRFKVGQLPQQALDRVVLYTVARGSNPKVSKMNEGSEDTVWVFYLYVSSI